MEIVKWRLEGFSQLRPWLSSNLFSYLTRIQGGCALYGVGSWMQCRLRCAHLVSSFWTGLGKVLPMCVPTLWAPASSTSAWQQANAYTARVQRHWGLGWLRRGCHLFACPKVNPSHSPMQWPRQCHCFSCHHHIFRESCPFWGGGERRVYKSMFYKSLTDIQTNVCENLGLFSGESCTRHTSYVIEWMTDELVSESQPFLLTFLSDKAGLTLT